MCKCVSEIIVCELRSNAFGRHLAGGYHLKNTLVRNIPKIQIAGAVGYQVLIESSGQRGNTRFVHDFSGRRPKAMV